jgi:hypothetical protein
MTICSKTEVSFLSIGWKIEALADVFLGTIGCKTEASLGLFWRSSILFIICVWRLSVELTLGRARTCVLRASHL